jgi:hypothetical protein
VRFEWDEEKNLQNQSKHAVAFEDASRVFESEADSFEIFDAAHSEDEDRFITIGPANGALLVVIYTQPEDGVIRIISARPATEHERTLYRVQMDRSR